VSLTLKSGEKPNQRMAEAAAALVSGSVANLSRHKVNVLINMQPFNVRDREDPDLSGGVAGEEWLGMQQKAEQYYKRKIDEYFAAWVEGVISTVSVDPNFKRTEQTVHAVDPKNVFQKEVSAEQVTEESNSTQNGAAEPGLASNAPLAIAEAPAGGNDATSTTNDKTKTDFVVDYGKTNTRSTDPGGNARVTGASVLLPRSHFVRTYRKNKGMSDDQQPDETVLEAFIAQELVRLKPAVQRCLNGASPEIVHVESYTDLMPLASVGSPQVASAAPMMLLVTSHAKEIALGALALVSLFMVSSMVKKGSASPIAATYAGAVKNAPLAPPEELAGEVRESGPLLDGMELDEDSVKAQQMLNQVANLVEENPDAAATLVKRWLNRS
jgi:flagellar biosynthesis/type III secretory pathway M-ring protein FliF/YscJ